MMHIGFRKLNREELGELFSQCAIGTFFDDEPIAYYGGRVACFAAACNMRKVVNTMHLMQEVIGFDPVNECPAVWTKYLPIHAAAANGLSSMVEYLVEQCGASSEAECRDGFSMVRPMVLAARLGMQATFKDLLERCARHSQQLTVPWQRRRPHFSHTLLSLPRHAHLGLTSKMRAPQAHHPSVALWARICLPNTDEGARHG